MKKKLLAIINLTQDEVLQCYPSLYSSYMAVWTWSAARYSGIAGMRHESFYQKYGAMKYWQRINKVRIAFGLKPYTGIFI